MYKELIDKKNVIDSLLRKGATRKEIASLIGCHECTIKTFVKKHSLYNKRNDKQKLILTLQNKINQGQSKKEIAQEYNYSASRLIQITKDNKINTKCKKCGNEFKRKTRDLHCSFECRFWSNVEIKTKDECWNWIGASKNGQYGRIRKDKSKVYSNRAAYEIAFGEISAGQIVRHKCDNPSCCNPNHLVLGSHKDNARDCIERGRFIAFGKKVAVNNG